MGKLWIYMLASIALLLLIGFGFLFLQELRWDKPFSAIEINDQDDWMLVFRNRNQRDEKGNLLEQVWVQEDIDILNDLKDKIRIKGSINSFLLYQNEASAEKFHGNSAYLYKNNQLLASRHYPGSSFAFTAIKQYLLPAQYKSLITIDYKELLTTKEQLARQYNIRFLPVPSKEAYEFHTLFFFPFGKKIKESTGIQKEMVALLKDHYDIQPEQTGTLTHFVANPDNPEITDFIGLKLSLATHKDFDQIKEQLQDTPYYLGSIYRHEYSLEYLILKTTNE